MDRRARGEAGPESFDTLRPLLFAIAYRMLASVSDAEDVIQEGFLRFQRARAEGIEIVSLKAYLAAVVTRLSIDHLRSARMRREEYIGVWLPEPLLTDGTTDDPARNVERSESLSMAFLLVLERLNPVERAVFLLHDVFGYGYEEIASIVGKSEANCRQIAARSRRRIRAERPRFDTSPETRTRLAERFFAAITDGDVEALVRVLADDAVVYGDGGGQVPQWSAPIVGVDRVARLLAGLGQKMKALDLRLEPRAMNGQLGALLRDAEGRIVGAWAVDFAGETICTLHSVINPDKLRHLGRLVDYRSLAAGRRHV